MTKDRHYLAASYLVDSIMHDLEFLHSKLNVPFEFKNMACLLNSEMIRFKMDNLARLPNSEKFKMDKKPQFLYHEGSRSDFEVKRETLSTMRKSLEKGNPNDLQIYETCMKILMTCSLQTTKMDKHILIDFNDSLMTRLWELLLCKTSFMVSVKGQMRILFEGLRVLRSILLRKPQEEQMGDQHQLDGKIVTILREAGIAIYSLYLNEANKVDDVGSSSVVRDSLPHDCCCALLVNIDRDIQLIKSQIAGSNMIEEEFHKIWSLMTSKGMKKVRVSIGSREKMAHRVLNDARRGAKDKQQKQSKREKERGLNIGSIAEAARTIL
ncbi:hypothetical protein ACH5RR_028294 [Cinchona calisaya]|uniref:Uncharacterized protein n=1 Tax=Cinchona calisaya TaxID=153742 RepID=A0ABD2YTM7_9GENT